MPLFSAVELKWSRAFSIACIVIVVAGVIAFIYRDSLMRFFVAPQRITFYSDFSTRTLELTGTMLRSPASAYIRQTPLVLEEGSALPSGARPVLANPPEGRIAFGMLFSDGTFKQVGGSYVYAAGLDARKDGGAVFASFTPAVPPTAAASGTWDLHLYSPQADAVTALGPGYGPRFLPDGSLLAFNGAEGVVRIDPVTNARTRIILEPGLSYAVSPGLSRVAVLSLVGTVDIYALETEPPFRTEHLGDINTLLYPFAFISEQELAGFDSARSGKAYVYSLTQDGFPPVRTLSVSP